jgi:endonuclease YncB( thermonuclease family)
MKIPKIISICILAAITTFVIYDGQTIADTWSTVRWVDDGDTVVLIDDRRIRYIGIDAPEIAHGDQKAQPHGYSARNYNKRLVYKKKVRLEHESQRIDRHGRILAYVFLGNRLFVNKELIRRGYAYYLPQRRPIRYAREFLQAQREAMSARRGIWKNWQEKGRFRGYVGNRVSKRYHLRTCLFGKQIAKKNRIFFSSRWEAFWGGYAPGKRCLKAYWKAG